MLVLTWRMQFRKAIDLLHPILPERNIKMNANSFTPEQAKRANQVVLDLMKNHRFFLAKDHTLDPVIFSESIKLHGQLRDSYKKYQALTTQYLKDVELALGFIPPVLKDGQTTVRCSVYSGSLEIRGIYPVQKFLDFMPEHYWALYHEIFRLIYPQINNSDTSKESYRNEENGILTGKLWSELCEIKHKENGLVVVMDTKFKITYKDGFDTLENKIRRMTLLPKGLAYLFFKNECSNPLIKNSHVLFEARKNDHVLLTHLEGQCAKLSFAQGGYDKLGKFVCLM